MNTISRYLVATSALVLSFSSLVATPAFANGCGIVSGDFDGGDGGASTPFLVSSASQLASMENSACLTNSYNFLQTADIDLSGVTWTPLGTTFDFNGTFDGGFHTISNLSYSGASAGLFGTVAAGVVKNLRIVNASVTSTSGFAGILASYVKNGSTISQISVAGSITGAQETGGLIGLTSGARSTISRVSVDAQVTAGSNAGGLIGQIESKSATVSDCIFYGSVATTGNNAGGMVGYGINPVIARTYSTGGTISATGASAKVGGILGLVAGTDASLSLTSSFYLSTSVTSNSALDGTSTTSGDLATTSTYTNSGWSVTTDQSVLDALTADTLASSATWFMLDSFFSGRPVLSWEYFAGYWSAGVSSAVLAADGVSLTLNLTDGIIGISSGDVDVLVDGSIVTYTPINYVSGSRTYSLTLDDAVLPSSSVTLDKNPGTWRSTYNPYVTVPVFVGFSVTNNSAISAPVLPYQGPVISAPGASKPASAGSTISLKGSNLAGVTKAVVAGLDCAVLVVSAGEIQITIPSGLPSGSYDIIISSDSGLLTVQDGLVVIANTSSIELENVTAVTKLKQEGTVKMYAKNVVGAGKVQMFFNGEEIAWVNASTAANSKLRNGDGSSYLVRTVTLVPGQKNILEIYVDSVRVTRSAYTGPSLLL
jgi:hypothetical protein